MMVKKINIRLAGIWCFVLACALIGILQIGLFENVYGLASQQKNKFSNNVDGIAMNPKTLK